MRVAKIAPDLRTGQKRVDAPRLVIAVVRNEAQHGRVAQLDLAREVELRYTPVLRFVSDDSYDEARRIDQLLASPQVRRDLRDTHIRARDEDEDEGE